MTVCVEFKNFSNAELSFFACFSKPHLLGQIVGTLIVLCLRNSTFFEKGFQQLAVIRKMVADLNIPVHIFGVPIVRDHDGLALSSRNGYLSAQQRAVAPALQQGLQALKAQIKNGRRDYATLFEQFKTDLQAAGFRLDYVELRDALSLQPAAMDSTQLVLLAAAYLGSTRLIDNLIFDL